MILKPDLARLQRQIDELGVVSEAPPPIVTRILFSEAVFVSRPVLVFNWHG